MTTSPQDDLTAERAAAIVKTLRPNDPKSWVMNEIYVKAVLVRIRQEALREYREAIAHKFQLDHCHRTNTFSNKQIIAALEQIDIELARLASEGG